MKYIVCVDIGGTTFSFVIFLNNKIFFKSDNYNIKCFKDSDKFVKFLIEKIKEKLKKNKIFKISIASPGPLNFKTGYILNTPNIKFLQNTNIIKIIKNYMDCDNIVVDNDANVFTLGCYYNLTNFKNINITNNDVLVGLTLGTGIGVGIIINNKIFRGSYGMAGEYDSSPLLNNMKWSDIIGYQFFKNITKKLIGKEITPKDLYFMAKEDNVNALEIWKEYGSNIGLYLSNIIGIINPNYISIGGGISKANLFFHNYIINTLIKKCITFKKDKIKFIYDEERLNTFYGGIIL